MRGKVELCGVNTSELRVLKNEEMKDLLRRVKEGDQEARQQMIEGNLRLVLSVIQRFAGRGESMDDLFQIGCVGLIKAIDNFDCENFNVKFSTYGVPMIAGEVRRYLRDSSAIRVSRSLRDTAYRVLQVREAWLGEHQREPTVDEIAQSLGLKREEVVMAMDAIADPISLYEPVYSEGGDTLCVMDQVKDERNTDERWLEHIALGEAMDQLSERERRILELRFFQGRTQMEVSAEVGISQAQVSRLEKGAIRQISSLLRS
jgi:RNA polymerase sporulation-specific sigma factor